MDRRSRILLAQKPLVDKIQELFWTNRPLADQLTQRQSDLLDRYDFTHDELRDAYGSYGAAPKKKSSEELVAYWQWKLTEANKKLSHYAWRKEKAQSNLDTHRLKADSCFPNTHLGRVGGSGRSHGAINRVRESYTDKESELIRSLADMTRMVVSLDHRIRYCESRLNKHLSKGIK